MKGKKWQHLYKTSWKHLGFHLSLMAIIMIMWIQIWSVILGLNMEGTGRANLIITSIKSTKISKD